MSARLINRIDTRPLVHGLALADSMSVPYSTLYTITIQISDCIVMHNRPLNPKMGMCECHVSVRS